MKLLNIITALTLPALAISQAPQHHQIPLSPPQSTISIPHLGFGTWNLDKSNVSAAVSFAIQTGYRHIDCAAIYGNEKDVGKGIADGLGKAGITREDIWVTSKLWNDHHRPDMVEKALHQTLSDLGLEYLDLYLMHWPVASSPINGKTTLDYIDTWHAMTLLPNVRNFGISNFSPAQLSHLLTHSSTVPFAHQMEIHPYLPQSAWLQYHNAHNIHVTAYSPLANSNPTYDTSVASTSSSLPPLLLNNSLIVNIAEKRGCTPATVALAWGLSRGTSVIPKSSHAERIRENFGAGECGLEYGDFKAVEGLGGEGTRFNNPSQSWGIGLYEGLDGV
ncbi:hypothetical protein MMC12_005570 [Toensbergia leucococca]|nr:hypothetical protein [Toensbergia leucococca]